MPIWEYSCSAGHRRDRLVKIADRDAAAPCLECGLPLSRVEISRAHVAPDGVYSYAPNIGDPERFERQREAIKSGQKTIPRSPSKADLERWGNEKASPRKGARR